jgi:hypothetical protein
MPIYPYVTDIGGGFRDTATLTRWLNVTRRNILLYALAQNLPKVSAFVKILLDKADSQPFQHDFVIFPVYGGPDATNQANMAPRYIDFTTGAFTEQSYYVDVLYARFTPTGLYQTFGVTIFEGAYMESPNNIIDTVQLRIEEAVRQLFLGLQIDLMGSRGTDDQKFYGIKDAIDNGVNQPVFGGIDRATYPWWNSPVYNYSDLDGGENRPIYQVIHRAINAYWADHGNIYGLPAIAITDPKTFTKIAESFTALERYVVGDMRTIADVRSYAIRGIDIGGISIFPDPYLTNYSTGTPPTYYGDIYFVNLDHLHFTGASPFEYFVTEWWPNYTKGYLSFSSLCLLTGQLYTDRPRAHFVLKGVPSMA